VNLNYLIIPIVNNKFYCMINLKSKFEKGIYKRNCQKKIILLKIYKKYHKGKLILTKEIKMNCKPIYIDRCSKNFFKRLNLNLVN
jgi:hypothetical protein